MRAVGILNGATFIERPYLPLPLPTVLIVLPPSNGMTPPSEGPSLMLDSLSFTEGLFAPRKRVSNALTTLSGGSKKRAITTLGLTPGLASELERNAALATAPASPAIDAYTGVLFEALGWSSLTASAKRRGQSQVLIVSALFGILRPHDMIPAYRLSMDVALPKIGRLGTYWKKHLPNTLDGLENRVVVDLRSQTYLSAWTPNPAITARVRVFNEKAGKRSIISHMAKKTRGEAARTLLGLAATPKSIDEVAHALNKGFEIEVVKPTTRKNSYFLDVILRT